MIGLWLLLLGCSGGAAPAAAGHRTQSGHYAAELRFIPEHPALGELFDVEATVRTRDGEPLEVGKVVLNARMPQHNHGMETDPLNTPGVCEADGTRCTHPGGVYLAKGFKFHMPGSWTVTIDVVGPRGPDSTSVVYEMK